MIKKMKNVFTGPSRTVREKRDRIKGYLGFVILAIFVVVGTVSSVTSILDAFK